MPWLAKTLIYRAVGDSPSQYHVIAPAHPVQQRRLVGIHFQCCSVYSRVYVNQQGTAYAGNCPRCGRKVILKMGRDETNARFLRPAKMFGRRLCGRRIRTRTAAGRGSWANGFCDTEKLIVDGYSEFCLKI